MATTDQFASTRQVGATAIDESAHQKNTAFQSHLDGVLDKLQHEPTAITAEDARRLHEHYDAKDDRSARLISAIEAVAAAHDDLLPRRGGPPTLGRSGHASLLMLVSDLSVAVDASPQDVTNEALKMAQKVVSKMQRAIGSANAPHPDLEAELQKRYTQIKPKVDQGIVTKAEADHLHSLEARAHGHTEKGGLTAAAQSVAAKRERQLSLSDGSFGRHGPIVSVPQNEDVKKLGSFHDNLAFRPKVPADPKSTVEESSREQAKKTAAVDNTMPGDNVMTAT